MSSTNAPACSHPVLFVFDDEDLQVVSAKFQDAVVRTADIAYLPGNRRFALVAARFDWAAALQGTPPRRCASGLHFDHVLKAARTGVPRDRGEAALNLLAIGFEATDAPAGVVTLTFSGGASIRLDVECLEAQMRDMGESWRTSVVPEHRTEALDAPANGPAARTAARR